MNDMDTIKNVYEQGRQLNVARSRACIEWWWEEELSPTEKAEEAAAQALSAILRGDHQKALAFAKQACRFEREEYCNCPAWRQLLRAIRAEAKAEVGRGKNQERIHGHPVREGKSP